MKTDLGLKRRYTGLRTTLSQAHTGFYLRLRDMPHPHFLRNGFVRERGGVTCPWVTTHPWDFNDKRALRDGTCWLNVRRDSYIRHDLSKSHHSSMWLVWETWLIPWDITDPCVWDGSVRHILVATHPAWGRHDSSMDEGDMSHACMINIRVVHGWGRHDSSMHDWDMTRPCMRETWLLHACRPRMD